MTTSNRKYYRGFSFDLWTIRGAWFWQLAGRCCRAGTIGSALTETEAVREAHEAVEEVSARCTVAQGRAQPSVSEKDAPAANSGSKTWV